ncbi:MAG: TonB-dependent receptor [Bacteroidaceae bacterium]|nr:TonB-dependent receptor [Bacteroidaceae bacterium]
MKRFAFLLSLSVASQSFAVSESTEPMDTLSQTMNEVTVTGTRNQTDIRHLPMTISVVNREQLTANERVNVLPTLMEQVPSLMVTSRGVMGYGVSTGSAGGMMLRGISSGSGQLLVLIDGHPQYQGIYGHSIADSYQTMMAERVEVLRGPASLLYGSNAMGGVVNIVTRGMQTDGVRTNVNLGAGSYGTIQGEASNQVRAGKFSSTVALQYGRSDNHRPNMGFEQYGGYLKLNYDINDNWNVFADGDVTHFNSSYPGAISKPMLEADQWITRAIATLGVENHYERTSGRLSVYDNFGRHKINDGYAANGGTPQDRFFRSKDALAGVSWYQSANFWTGNRITVGVDYQHIYGRAYYTNRKTGEVLDTPNKQSGHVHNNEVAGYVDFRQDIASWLTLDAGVRYDNHSITGGEWIPQGGFVVRPIKTGEFKAMASKGFRNPTTREMYLYPPSNTDLEPERLMNYEISWRQRLLDNHLIYGVNLFYIDADNIIQTGPNPAGPPPMLNQNTGELKNKGFEIEATWYINRHWALNTNHSYLHMENPVVAAPTYKGYLGAQMSYGKWSVNAGLQQVCGLYTAVGENEEQEDFTLLNATVSYQALDWLRLWAKGDNLLGQKYEINAGYPMPKATFMGGVSLTF